jgi:hypothetical protein
MAITRTALGTAVNKAGTADFSLTGGVVAGQILVVCGVHDYGNDLGTPLRLLNISSGEASNLTIDAAAVNTSGVESAILSVIVPTTKAWDGQFPFIRYFVSADANAIAVIRLDGLTSTPIDKISTGIGSSLTASSGATSTTAQADEILIGGIGWEGPDGDDAGTWQNSFNAGQRLGTTGAGAASNITVQEGFLIVAATGAYTAAVTRTANSRDWAAAIATYKESSFNPGVLGLKHVGNPDYSAITQLIQA